MNINRQNSVEIIASYHVYFHIMFSPCLWGNLGRRLKGTSQTRNGEEEPTPSSWGPGERGERAGRKDIHFEPGSAPSRVRNGENYCQKGWLMLIVQ